jgi:hypothetical protein
MVDVQVEQAAIKSDAEYWTIDLKDNDLEYNPQELKNKFVGEKAKYLGLDFTIEGIEFYSIVKDKIILVVKQN